jgi:hypothetical protein
MRWKKEINGRAGEEYSPREQIYKGTIFDAYESDEINERMS